MAAPIWFTSCCAGTLTPSTVPPTGMISIPPPCATSKTEPVQPTPVYVPVAVTSAPAGEGGAVGGLRIEKPDTRTAASRTLPEYPPRHSWVRVTVALDDRL